MSDATQGVYSAVSELGYKLDSMEESPSEEVVTESTEAEGETASENLEAKPEVEGNENVDSVVTEEEPQATEPVAVEEPKLTFKQFQELETERKSLETERQAFTEQKALMEKEFQEKYHEKVKVHDQLDDFLAHVAEKDPELFDIFKAEFAEHQKQYSNPVLDQVRSEMDSLRKELGAYKNNASDEVTRTKLDSEMNQVKATLGKEAEAAGIKPDWTKIEDVWADNPKLSVEAAFYAVYGKNLITASASKAKVVTATKKAEGRPVVSTAGNVSRSNTPANAKVPTNSFDAVKYYAAQITGKSY